MSPTDIEVTRWLSYVAAWAGGWAIGVVFGMWIGVRKFRALTHLRARMQAMDEIVGPRAHILTRRATPAALAELVDERTIALAGRAVVEKNEADARKRKR